jgi:hypothetical protein
VGIVSYAAPQQSPPLFRGLGPASAGAYTGLDPNYQAELGQYDKGLYSGPDYKGRHETNQTIESQLGNMYREWQNERPVDYSGASQIGGLYNNANNQLQARLGAMGISGGAAGGATAGLLGRENSSVANYYTQQNQMRQQQHFLQQQQFDQWARGLMGQGLQRNIQQQQNKGGFWKDLLGVGGSILGGVVGKALHLGGDAQGQVSQRMGDAFGGGQQMSPGQYGYEPGYGGPGPDVYGPYQPNSSDPTQGVQPYSGQTYAPDPYGTSGMGYGQGYMSPYGTAYPQVGSRNF